MVTAESEVKPNLNHQIEHILDLGGQVIRQQFGEEAYPTPFERPPRPELLDKIISTAKEALINRYGPEADILDVNSIHWVSKEEFDAVGEYHKGKTPVFIKTSLAAVGIKNYGEDDEQVDPKSFTLTDQESLQIFFNAEKYSPDITTPQEGQDIASKLLTSSIYYSNIPRQVLDDDAFMEAFKQAFERDRRTFPRKYPELNLESLNILIDNLKLMAGEDATRHVILSGAQIRLIHTFTEKSKDTHGDIIDKPITEDMAITGSSLHNTIAMYLSDRARSDLVKIWAGQYSNDPKEQKSFIKRMEATYQVTEANKMEFTRLETFLKSIQVIGYTSLFRALHDSSIPLIFAEAKKKNKKLGYPS